MGNKKRSVDSINNTIDEFFFKLDRAEVCKKIVQIANSAPVNEIIPLMTLQVHIVSFQRETQNGHIIIPLTNAFLNVYKPIFLNLFNDILCKLFSDHEKPSFKQNMSKAFKSLTIIINKISTQDKGTAILLGLINLFEGRSIEEFIQDLEIIVSANGEFSNDENIQELIQTLAEAEKEKPISLSSNPTSFYNTTSSANTVSDEEIKPRVS